MSLSLIRPTREGSSGLLSLIGESPLGAQQPGLIAAPVTCLLGLSLVVQLLALGDAKLDLGDASQIKIDLQRHQGHAFALHRCSELARFASAHEKLAHPSRLVIEAIGHVVFGDVGVVEEYLAILRMSIGLGDSGLAGAAAFQSTR